jgi:hypothetical protein
MPRLWMAAAIARFSKIFEIVARHLLGSIGCAIGAKVTHDIKAVVDAFGGKRNTR